MIVTIDVPEEPPILVKLRMNEAELYDLEDIFMTIRHIGEKHFSADQMDLLKKLGELVAGAAMGKCQNSII